MKASSALNSMGNRYFSCLKTLWALVLPFLLLLLPLLGPILRFVDASWAIASDVCSLVCCLLTAIRYSPSAVCGYLRLPALRYPTVLRSFVKLSVPSGLKFASRNSGCSRRKKRITNLRRFFYLSYLWNKEINTEIMRAQ